MQTRKFCRYLSLSLQLTWQLHRQTLVEQYPELNKVKFTSSWSAWHHRQVWLELDIWLFNHLSIANAATTYLSLLPPAHFSQTAAYRQMWDTYTEWLSTRQLMAAGLSILNLSLFSSWYTYSLALISPKMSVFCLCIWICIQHCYMKLPLKILVYFLVEVWDNK